MEPVLDKLRLLQEEEGKNDLNIEDAVRKLTDYLKILNNDRSLSCTPLKNYLDRFITVKDAAKKAKIANSVLEERDVRNAARRGEFRTWLANRRLYILESDLVEFIEENGILAP